MDKKKIRDLCVFNVGIVIFSIIIFSKSIVNLSPFSKNTLVSAISITLIIMIVIIFFYRNYTLIRPLFFKSTYTMDELNKPKEFLEVLNSYSYKDALTNYISNIVSQINELERKKKTLHTVLYQKFENEAEEYRSLVQVVEDTSLLLFENIKKILSRIEIFDQEEYVKLCKLKDTLEKGNPKMQIFHDHIAYVKEYITKNDAILLQFDNLLIEVTKLGDKDDQGGMERFQEIANAMKKLRTNDDTSDLESKYK